MAVTTTTRMILQWAYGKSLKNVPGAIATESDELFQLVLRAMRGLYAAAARVNPTFFGTSANVVFAGTGWARPQDAELIFRLTNATTNPGSEIVVVPFDNPMTEPGMGAVYRWGQVYIPAGHALDPINTDHINFFYSKRPSVPANLDATIDALWQEDFNELLVLIVALYLAEKDGRKEEIEGYMRDIEKWTGLYVAFLEHETVNERKNYGHIHRFNTPSMVPILSLLTGHGAAVK